MTIKHPLLLALASIRSRMIPLSNARSMRYIAGVFLSMALIASLHAQSKEPASGPDLNSRSNVILEVINMHFTVGKKIPSLYLRLLSDGTAESDAIKFTGQEHSDVKRKFLSPKEFEELKAVLNQPALQSVKGRYECPRLVVLDSWMEWELEAPGSRLAHSVTISFGPATQSLRPYPAALAALGCQIIKIRSEIAGDETNYYRSACRNPS